MKILSTYLSALYNPPHYVHGFIRQRGIRTNAESHLGCQHLLKLDFDNFYEQIDKDRIAMSLIESGVPSEIAVLISNITTIDNKLAQGFSTSPVISNIVSIKLDNELNTYSRRSDLIYTRYADDMCFSSKTAKPNFEEISEIIESNGFVLNVDKTQSTIRGNFQTVTGLTVFDHDKPRIRKRIKRRLRLEVHYIKTLGLRNHAIHRLTKNGKLKTGEEEKQIEIEMELIKDRIEGWINFSYGIEREFSNKLRTKLYG